MSGKVPKNTSSAAVLESGVGKNGSVLFPRIFRALSFEEICSQARARCDDNGEETALAEYDKAGSHSPHMHFGSPFCVIPSFDDICALHGIANTTEWESVGFTDMLTDEPSSVNAKGASIVWPDVKSDLFEGIEVKNERCRDEFQYQKVNTDAKPQSHCRHVQEPVGDDGSTDNATIKDDHGNSGATLVDKLHINRKRAGPDKNAQLKEKCRKRTNQRMNMKNKRKIEVQVTNVSETAHNLGLPSSNSNEASHLKDSSADCDVQVKTNDANGKTMAGIINKVTENTDTEEVFTEHAASHSQEVKQASAALSTEKIQSTTLRNTPNAQDGQSLHRRKIFSGQKLESICQKLMKIRDRRSCLSSPEDLQSTQKHLCNSPVLLQTSDNQATTSGCVVGTSRSTDHESRPEEEGFEENRKSSQDSQLACSHRTSNDVTRDIRPHQNVADIIVSHPDEPLCDLFSSPTDSYHSITSTDTVDW